MVTALAVPGVEVSQGMLDLADQMELVAQMIRDGKVRAGSMCYVESGPDMYITSDWASMTGRSTMVGGLFRLMTDVSAG